MESGVQHPVPRSLPASSIFICYLKKYNYILGRIFFNKLKKGCVTFDQNKEGGTGLLNKRDHPK